MNMNMKHKVVYTAIKVTCGWAGAVINRSPKDNMQSAIPIALLFMVVD